MSDNVKECIVLAKQLKYLGNMLLLFGNMEKVILSILIFVCHSHQRPQLEVDVLTTTETTDTTTEETKSLEKISQATEATAAVSVQTSVNFSSYSPSAIFEDFKPSNYYRPDGNPIFERPSPQVTHEVFHKPEYFARPNNQTNRLPLSKPSDNNVVFPQATQEHYSQYSQFDNRSNGPESRGPYKFTEVLPQQQHPKPMKHDFGGTLPISGYNNNFYERNFGKYHRNEMSQYPDIIHEPPKVYHSVTTHKKDPWRSMLKLLATILPVGLLLASFPPTVIKVNSTQYPYQFQKNSTVYHPNVITGRYKALRNMNTEWKIDGEDKSPRYLDDCLKKKICETLKSNYSHSQLETLQQNYKLNWTTDNGPTMVEIAKAAASAEPESCQVFVCSD